MKMPSLERLGKPGVLALGVLLFCLIFYASHIAPNQAELNTLKNELARLSSEAQTHPAEKKMTSEANNKRGQLAPFSSFTDALKELNALSEQHGLQIDRGTYQLSAIDKQQRLEVNLPLTATYASLRAFLRDLLKQPTEPRLDELVLQRQKATDTAIEANLQLSYYFAPPP